MIALMEAIFIILAFVQSYSQLTFGLHVSRKLNTMLVFRLMHASLTKFFNNNPIGKILNRLSGDLEVVDHVIAGNILTMVNQFSSIVIQVILITKLSSPYIFVFICAYFVILVRLQRTMNTTYYQVIRLAQTSKTPFYSLFADMTYGVIDISLHRRKQHFMKRMSVVVDYHFKAAMCQSAIQHWFKMRCSLLTIMFIAPNLAYMIFFKSNIFENLSIIIFTLLESIDTLIKFLNKLNELTKNLVSFDRCSQYGSVEPEGGLSQFACYQAMIEDGRGLNAVESSEREFLRGSSSQLQDAELVFDNVCAKYNLDGCQVLSDVSLHVNRSEKIGIIGKSGSGKTSLITTLVRFFDAIGGHVYINDKDMYEIDAKLLRNGITYMSQESTFFEGTLKENLDPFGLASDE